MHVLVIGGTRNVGYQLVWRLLAAGQQVTILNRSTRTDPFGSRVERVVADRTTPAFAQALGGRQFDAAVDFAAYTGEDARGVLKVLGQGRCGHYVFVSTGQVYLVRAGCPSPAREADYEGPVLPEPSDTADHDEWLYGVNKRAAEDALASAWESERFPATRLRLPMVDGERDHYRRMESYLWRLLDGGPVLLPDGGTQAVRHAYSGSVVTAISELLGKEATFGRAYNLCQDEMPTLAELLTMVADALGAKPRFLPVSTARLEALGLSPKQVSPFSTRWMSCLDPTLAKAELGFSHESLRQYIEKIVACFLNNPPPDTPENYKHRQLELRAA